MSDRITIDPFVTGSCVPDPPAASFIEPRVKFVRGWLTGGVDPADGSVECGDGTTYPLEVTAAQLFEIMYRVRDAEFTAGEFRMDDLDLGEWATITPSGIPRGATLVEYSGDGAFDALSARGYCVLTNDISPNDPFPDAPADTFANPYYYLPFFGDTAARDALTERSMWANNYSAAPKDESKCGHLSSGYSSLLLLQGTEVSTFRTGFNQTSMNYFGAALTSIYGVWGAINGFEVDSAFCINIKDKVAFIDDTGSGNPFDSGNRLFVQLTLVSECFSATTISTEKALLSIPVDSGLRLKLGLAGGAQVSCPIYFDEGYGFPTYTSYSTSGSDFVLQAAEWWPYKKLDGTDAWDTATGAPNGNPSA